MGVVVGIILVLIMLGCGGGLVYNQFRKVKSVKMNIGLGITTFVAFIMFIIVPFSIRTVDTTEIAVVKVWGSATEVRQSGTYFDFWLPNSYVYIDTTTQEISEVINAYSLDAQTMDSTLSIQFRVQQDKAINIINEYGVLENLTERITSLSEEKAKVVLSSQSAMDIIATRSELSGKLEDALRESLSDYYVDLTLAVVPNIQFSDAFEQVVEDKMVAEQEKITAEYEKEKAIIKAEEELEVAKLDAEKALEQAIGEANAIEAIAQAEANAIKIKSIETARMLGFDIVETVIEVDGVSVTEYNIDFEGKSAEEIAAISDYIKYIEYLSTWDGVLPTVMTDDSATIMIPVTTTTTE